MTVATVTNKGAIVIPEEIREYLKLDTGTKIEFVIDEDGRVKMIPLKFGVEDLAGLLHRPGMKKATIEDMENAILEGANDRT